MAHIHMKILHVVEHPKTANFTKKIKTAMLMNEIEVTSFEVNVYSNAPLVRPLLHGCPHIQVQQGLRRCPLCWSGHYLMSPTPCPRVFIVSSYSAFRSFVSESKKPDQALRIDDPLQIRMLQNTQGMQSWSDLIITLGNENPVKPKAAHDSDFRNTELYTISVSSASFTNVKKSGIS